MARGCAEVNPRKLQVELTWHYSARRFILGAQEAHQLTRTRQKGLAWILRTTWH